MKRFLLFMIPVTTICINAHANTCTTTYDDYYSCKPGYYLTSGNCEQCPQWSGVFTNSTQTITIRGTSKDSNTSGITSCYIPTGTYYDVTGTFTLSENCNYTN